MRRRALIVLSIAAVIAALWFVDRPRGSTQSEPRTVAGSSRLSELLSDQGVTGYAKAIEARKFSFPEDHGPHPEYRNEWWYVTGNLDGDDGERYGFELTLFRFSLTPLVDVKADVSAWRTNQVYIGHFALTNVADGQFHVAQRYSRASLGLAGASANPFRVWLEDWSIGQQDANNPAKWALRASAGDISLSLDLDPQRRPVLHGVDGLSRKSNQAGNASYYYSISRFASTGTLQIGNRSFAVSGLSWLDREWGSSALSADQQGWDWFALQLSNGADLMFYRLRKNDGSTDEHSAGTWLRSDGSRLSLAHSDVEMKPLRYWDSPSGGRYPLTWQLSIESLGLDLTIRPVLDTQELHATVRYWEGAVDIDGFENGTPINGRGYLELTGYDRNE